MDKKSPLYRQHATGLPTTYCVHREYAEDHCASMSCENYINKCSQHSLSPGPNVCSHVKMDEARTES